MKRVAIASLVLLVSLPLGAARRSRAEAETDDSLFAQSARTMLAREFADPNVSYILADASTGTRIAVRWEEPERLIPVGSLAKPFAALAYARHHDRFPKFTCQGAADRCWLPRGHGEMEISSAIGHSCNAYFRKLSRQLPREDVDEVITEFGAGELKPDSSTDAYYGIGPEWRMSADQVIAAYQRLAISKDRGAQDVRRGMMIAASQGTAKVIDRNLRGGALAKTGTAPCSHSKAGGGDGFVVVLFPADSPRNILLVRLHGSTGAKSADVAGRMIARLGEPTQ